MTKSIELSQGKCTIVDDEDYDFLIQWKWCVMLNHQHFYAMRRPSIYMHRVIMQAPGGVQVDHRDGDGLNNTRSNLRLAILGQNMHNRQINKNNKSGYKGVRWVERDSLWYAHIGFNGKRIHVGCFHYPI